MADRAGTLKGRMRSLPSEGVGHLWRTAPLALALAVLAAGMVWMATPKGLMVTTDSVAYLQAAENLLEGRGLSVFTGEGRVKPLVHFPPLFPLVLAGMGLLSLPLLEAARGLNAVLYGCTVLLSWWLLRRHTGDEGWSLFGTGVLAVSPILLAEHTRAMSEPLYLFLALAALGALLEVTRRPGWEMALIAGGLSGLAYLTRYVGVSLVLTGAVALGLQRGLPVRRRLAQLVTFLAAAVGPQAFWMLRNWLLAGTLTNRTLVWHPPDLAFLKRPVGLLWAWLMPFKFTYPVLLASVSLLGAGCIGLMLWAWRERALLPAKLMRQLASPSLAWVCGLHAALYTGVLLGTVVFLDASTPFDLRLTAPVYLVLGLALFATLSRQRQRRGRLAARAAGVLIAVLLLSYSLRSVGLVAAMRQSPGGLAFEGWQDSVSLRTVTVLPKETVFYTDDPQALYFYTHRTGYLFPQATDPVTQRARPDFLQALDRLTERAQDGCVAVVFFDTVLGPTARARLEAVGLRQLAADPVAEVLVVGPSRCAPGAGG